MGQPFTEYPDSFAATKYLTPSFLSNLCGCSNAYVISKAARFTVSADDKIGILNFFFGENFTMSHTRVADVFVTSIF